jgi:hypothetical protein
LKHSRIKVIAWKTGRVVGFAYYPVVFLIVARLAWVAADIVGRR